MAERSRYPERMDWFWAIVGFMTADEWQAAGTLATFVVAVAAALYARGQVAEARRSREEQARPYVAVYLELVDDSNLDLVVKNFGTTTARNITMTSDIPMKRIWAGDVEDLLTFDLMPVLVPGQEWRTMFDAGGQRFGQNDDVYTLTVRSSDSQLRQLPDEVFVLDWHTYENRIYAGKKTVDDIGTALGKIADDVHKWTDRSGNGMGVVSRDGDARDLRREQDRPAREARKSQTLGILRPDGPSGSAPELETPPAPEQKPKRTRKPRAKAAPKDDTPPAV